MENRSQNDSLKNLSIDEVIQTALRLEEDARKFYASALDDVGPDAVAVFTQLLEQQDERIQTLRSLLAEVEELRDLSMAMVG